MFEKEITQGVKYLNERDPDWFRVVDPDTLDMGDPDTDVLGQTDIDGDHLSQELGFYTPHDNDVLNDEWKQVIRSLQTRPPWHEVPKETTIFVQNDDGTWCPGSYQYAEPSSIGGWLGKPADSGRWFDTAYVRTDIPNPAWRATYYERPRAKAAQIDSRFIVGETYEVVKTIPGYLDHGKIGTKFVVEHVDGDEDAVPEGKPSRYFEREYLRDGYIRRVTNHQEQEIMDMNDLYIAAQREWINENNAKVGDKVKILRAFKQNEMGLNNSCTGAMQRQVGMTQTIMVFDGASGISLDGGYRWPWFVLEKVESVRKPFPMKTIGGETIIVEDDALRIGCQRITFDEINDFIYSFREWMNDGPAINGCVIKPCIDRIDVHGITIQANELFEFIDHYEDWKKE